MTFFVHLKMTACAKNLVVILFLFEFEFEFINNITEWQLEAELYSVI